MGRNARYTEEVLRGAVAVSFSFAGVLRELGLEPGGGTQANIANKIRKLGIDHSHFTGQAHLKGKSPSNKLTAEQVLRVLPEGSPRLKALQLRRALEESGVEVKCNRCNLTTWNGKFLQLEVNHIDGDAMNCLRDNLEFICPNCHSQDSHTSMPHGRRNK